MNKVKLILLCGSSGSGKSTISNLLKEMSENINLKVDVLCQDSYYVDVAEGDDAFNYDHPDAFDWELLKKDIYSIMNGKDTLIPDYNYKNHKKVYKNNYINKPDILILEGIYSIFNEEINNLASLKIFVETPKDECLIRRIKRDVVERGRELDGILEQWRNTVRPMYDNYIEPLKIKANIIVPWSFSNQTAVDFLFNALKNIKE